MFDYCYVIGINLVTMKKLIGVNSIYFYNEAFIQNLTD
jgi:hypothetical protein